MHMADALVSPGVGGTFWAVSAGAIAFSSRKLRQDADSFSTPLMGVLGAFVFTAQMINFSIPGTGSSGHIGGGVLLAILLGNYAAFIVIASVLTVQALFFADGGLLALGCNIFNMGFLPCFVAYPLVYRPIAGKNPGSRRLLAAAMASCIIGLELGALGVAAETSLSGIADLPFRTFSLLMLSIHLAIAVAEGAITAAVVSLIRSAKPEFTRTESTVNHSAPELAAVLLCAAAVIGGGLSYFASPRPDGLEWAAGKTGTDIDTPLAEGVHGTLARVQRKTAVMPDYGFEAPDSSFKKVSGTGIAGITGALLTLLIAGVAGTVLRPRRGRQVV